jgi:hypothetical protein
LGSECVSDRFHTSADSVCANAIRADAKPDAVRHNRDAFRTVRANAKRRAKRRAARHNGDAFRATTITAIDQRCGL